DGGAAYPGGWAEFVQPRGLARAQAWQAFEECAGAHGSLVGRARQRREWADMGRRGPKATKEPDKHVRERHRARADRQAAKGPRLERAADRLAVVDQPRKEGELRYSIAEGCPSADIVATLVDAVLDRDGFRLGPVSVTVAPATGGRRCRRSTRHAASHRRRRPRWCASGPARRRLRRR
ncbi:MAG: hypothetical protein L0H79_14235, partial [Intrasporangium sp.]|nr:hypothetical protein [Intrasporangium sp.]